MMSVSASYEGNKTRLESKGIIKLLYEEERDEKKTFFIRRKNGNCIKWA